jgi:hypothetical protein
MYIEQSGLISADIGQEIMRFVASVAVKPGSSQTGKNVGSVFANAWPSTLKN